jgi:hypothetical protein
LNSSKATTSGSREKSLSYYIKDQPSTVHDLLLKKRNGKLALVVWGEKTTGREQVTIRFAKHRKAVQVYDPTVGTSSIASYGSTQEIILNSSDHPFVIEI